MTREKRCIFTTPQNICRCYEPILLRLGIRAIICIYGKIKEFRDKQESDSDSLPQHTIITIATEKSKLKILNPRNKGNEVILLGTY